MDEADIEVGFAGIAPQESRALHAICLPEEVVEGEMADDNDSNSSPAEGRKEVHDKASRPVAGVKPVIGEQRASEGEQPKSNKRQPEKQDEAARKRRDKKQDGQAADQAKESPPTQCLQATATSSLDLKATDADPTQSTAVPEQDVRGVKRQLDIVPMMPSEPVDDAKRRRRDSNGQDKKTAELVAIDDAGESRPSGGPDGKAKKVEDQKAAEVVQAADNAERKRQEIEDQEKKVAQLAAAKAQDLRDAKRERIEERILLKRLEGDQRKKETRPVDSKSKVWPRSDTGITPEKQKNSQNKADHGAGAQAQEPRRIAFEVRSLQEAQEAKKTDRSSAAAVEVKAATPQHATMPTQRQQSAASVMGSAQASAEDTVAGYL